ncbi:MAG TPA: tetratricopeptide repeat protein, partial [Syntrophales bacterium]|nr:tetratricopeptide repeat protein [Syntrophales bacterium]
LGKKKKVLEVCERYAAVKPAPEAFTLWAEYSMRYKEYSGAIKAYEKMIALDPKRGELYAGLGLAYSAKGDLDRAIENYRKALRYDREDDVTHLNLAAAYEKKGRYEEALKAYTMAYQLNPDSAEAARKIPEMKIRILKQKYGKKG